MAAAQQNAPRVYILLQTPATGCPWDYATLRVGDELVGAIDFGLKEEVTGEGKPLGRVCCKETLGIWIIHFVDKELCIFFPALSPPVVCA